MYCFRSRGLTYIRIHVLLYVGECVYINFDSHNRTLAIANLPVPTCFTLDTICRLKCASIHACVYVCVCACMRACVCVCLAYTHSYMYYLINYYLMAT